MSSISQMKSNSPLWLPPVPEGFVGRNDEINGLLSRLAPASIITLVAPPGFGKSALAYKLIHLAAKDEHLMTNLFPDGILWHNFYRDSSANNAILGFVRAYGEDLRDYPHVAAKSVLSKRCALILLDGTEDADDLPYLLEVCSTCGIIVTTTNQAQSGLQLYKVNHLSKKDSEEVLRNWAGNCRIDNDAMKTILTAIGGVALFLKIAGSFLSRNPEGLSEYICFLKSEPLKALHCPSGKHTPRKHQSVVTLFSHSVARLSSKAKRVLSIIGCLAHAPLESCALAIALNCEDYEVGICLDELVAYNLLEKRSSQYEFTHRLVHCYAHAHLSKFVKKQCIRRLVKYYIKLLGAEMEQAKRNSDFNLLDASRNHIDMLIMQCKAGQYCSEGIQLIKAAIGYLEFRGHSSSTLNALAVGIKFARSLHDKSSQFQFLLTAGVTHRFIGNLNEANFYHQAALKIARQSKDEHSKASAFNNLGNSAFVQGDFTKAINFYEQALAIWSILGDTRLEARVLGNLGNVYRNMKETEKSIIYSRRAIKMCSVVKDRGGVGIFMGNLGDAYRDLNNYKRASKYYQRALLISVQMGERRIEALCLVNLGDVLGKIGKRDVGIKVVERGIQLALDTGFRRIAVEGKWVLGEYFEASNPKLAVELMSERIEFERELGHKGIEERAKKVKNLAASVEVIL
jgi:tetratricopeptide (TPR) repeat protein